MCSFGSSTFLVTEAFAHLSTELATVEGAPVEVEVSRDTEVVESKNTLVVSDPNSMPTSLATDMVVTGSGSNEIRRLQKESELCHAHGKEIPTSREVMIDVPELHPRGFPQSYRGVTNGSLSRFDSVSIRGLSGHLQHPLVLENCHR